MDVPKWKYGPFIQSARLQKQLTIEKLAEKVGCTGRFLQAVEQGTKCPGAGLLLRLCDVLSISADALIRPETTRKDFIYRTLVLRLASYDESALMRMYLFQSIMEANPNLLEPVRIHNESGRICTKPGRYAARYRFQSRITTNLSNKKIQPYFTQNMAEFHFRSLAIYSLYRFLS